MYLKYMKTRNKYFYRTKNNQSQTRKNRRRQRGGVRFKPTTKEELKTAAIAYMRQENHDYGHIRTWDITLVTDLSGLFENMGTVNNNIFDGIQEWDTSNVTNMADMFGGCENFNQPLNAWSVSNVTNMSGMFEICHDFNQPLDTWNVSHVINMKKIFSDCLLFNQPLNTWNVSNVIDMSTMFLGCVNFNQPLNNWNVSNVTNMHGMFYGCDTFDQPLNDWNVSNITDMTRMFYRCDSFDQPLTNWNMQAQTTFTAIFNGCPISEENMPERIQEYLAAPVAHQPMPGIAYQVHNEFNTINKQELLSLLSGAGTRNFSGMNNPNFVNYVQQRLQEAIETNFSEEERQPLLTALDALYENLEMTESSNILTSEYRNLFGKALDFMLEQPPEVVKEYLNAYVQECAMAYGTNLDVNQMDPNNMSCVKGRFERLVMCIKTALLVQCIENPNAPTCLAIYKTILKKGFGVNISDSAVVALDKNELIQQWNSEHLENEEYKVANHVEDMTEEQRRDFFRNDFIQFMRSAYEQNESLTAAIQSMIEQEANQLDSADVFRNMMFGGRGRRRNKRATRKRGRNNRRCARKFSQQRRRRLAF